MTTSGWGALLSHSQRGCEGQDMFGDKDGTQKHAAGAEALTPVGPAPFTRSASATCSYIAQCAPPLHGKNVPQTAYDIATINIVSCERGLDTTGRKNLVVWYEFHCRTPTHAWSVQKRYSDCRTFHEGMKALNVKLEGFPSRHVLSAQDDAFVKKRRDDLEAYFRGAVSALRNLYDVAFTSRKPETLQTSRAAFNYFMDFIRSTSHSNAAHLISSNRTPQRLTPPPANPIERGRASNQREAPLLGTTSAPPLQSTPRDLQTAVATQATASSQPPTVPLLFQSESIEDPPCRISHVPGVCFAVVLFLPGVDMRDVYVAPDEGESSSVIIGGQWKPPLTAAALLERRRQQGLPLPSSGAATPTSATGAARQSLSTPASAPLECPHPEEVLIDTLPSGKFEATFRIPAPFCRLDWHSDFADGVLYLVWTEKAGSSTPPTSLAGVPRRRGSSAQPPSARMTVPRERPAGSARRPVLGDSPAPGEIQRPAMNTAVCSAVQNLSDAML